MNKVIVVLFAVFVAVTFTFTVGRLPSHPSESFVVLNIPPPGSMPVESVPQIDRSSAGLATPAQLANGAKVYRTLCVACHLPDGKGMVSIIPPLVGSDYMFADRERTIRGVLKGVSGPITVNEVNYNGAMPPLEAVLTDRQVADVLTYVFNQWGNQGDAFDAGFVGTVRALSTQP